MVVMAILLTGASSGVIGGLLGRINIAIEVLAFVAMSPPAHPASVKSHSGVVSALPSIGAAMAGLAWGVFTYAAKS